MTPLERLSGLLRGQPQLDPTELARYSTGLRPVLAQLGGLYARWRADLELDAAEEDLANSASIQRWEAAGLGERVAAIEPPQPLARLHGELAALAVDTARAAQLLSTGYRFHSSRARCDGQALMLEAEARFGSLRVSLAQLGVSVEPSADGGARAER